MNCLKRFLFPVIILLLTTVSKAAWPDVVDNTVFSKNIKTVLLYPTGFPTQMPVLMLGSPGPLLFSFDELGDERKFYSYTIIQCDYNWQPTDLGVYDYIDGFSEATINDYQYSAATKQKYVHYKLDFPNQDMRITKSGNYAIVVYEDDPSEPVITWRFMVAEPIVQIDAGVALPRNLSDRQKFQEILFNVYHKGFDITNPWLDVNAVVLQDDRWDNAITGIKPLFIRQDELQFNHNMKVVFETSRDFRRLDMRSFRYRGDGMAGINELNSSWDVYMSPDPVRTDERKYFFDSDINGKFFIDVYEMLDADYEGDYAYTHFYLPFDAPLNSGDIYVVGAFNNYHLAEDNRMKYNYEKRAYETTLFLKQGYYNYSYLYVDKAAGIREHSLIEGSYYDTEHDYTILIYFRSFGERYDRLIGIRNINSELNKY